MTNTIDPISYNAGIEAAAKALREHEMKGRITVPWDRVPKSQKAKWLEKASIVVAAIHRTEPQTAPDMKEREDGVLEIIAPYREQINGTPELLSVLYDIDMLPEQTVTRAGAIRLAAFCELWKRLPSAAPADAERPALAERIDASRDVWVGDADGVDGKMLTHAQATLIVSSLRAGDWREDMENAPKYDEALRKYRPCDVWVVNSNTGGRLEQSAYRLENGMWLGRGGYFLEWDNDGDPDLTSSRVTHWMPLASAPKNTDKEG